MAGRSIGRDRLPRADSPEQPDEGRSEQDAYSKGRNEPDSDAAYHGSDRPQEFTRYPTVVERVLHPFDLLIILVALPGDQHDVSGTRLT